MTTYEVDIDDLKVAADGGDADAQFALGNIYAILSPDDFMNEKKAVKYWEKAQYQEHLGATCALAEAYELGMGFSSNEGMADTLWEAAAKRGHPKAQCKMGDVHYREAKKDPECHPHHKILAGAWYSVAAANGNEDAADSVKILEDKLSRSEFNSVQCEAEKVRYNIKKYTEQSKCR